jgi:hypothetical protein
MFGIEDKWVALAFLLCLLSSLLCVLYSWWNWNKGEAELHDEDVRWATEEDKVEKNL